MKTFKITERPVTVDDPLVVYGWVHPGGLAAPVQVWHFDGSWVAVRSQSGKWSHQHLTDTPWHEWRHVEMVEARM